MGTHNKAGSALSDQIPCSLLTHRLASIREVDGMNRRLGPRLDARTQWQNKSPVLRDLCIARTWRSIVAYGALDTLLAGAPTLCIPHLSARINNSMNIAFIGLGNMGSAMATNLTQSRTHALRLTTAPAPAPTHSSLWARASPPLRAKPLPALKSPSPCSPTITPSNPWCSEKAQRHSRLTTAQRDPRFHEHHQRCPLPTAGRLAR